MAMRLLSSARGTLGVVSSVVGARRGFVRSRGFLSFGLFGEESLSRRVSISICVASARSMISSTSLQWRGRSSIVSWNWTSLNWDGRSFIHQRLYSSGVGLIGLVERMDFKSQTKAVN